MGELPIVVLQDGLSEQEAITLEIELIVAIGRADQNKGPLFNRTDGGEGLSGYVMSPETRRLHGLARRGKKMSAEARERMRISAQERWRRANEHQRLIAYHASMSIPEQRARASKISRATRLAMREKNASEKIKAYRRKMPLTEAQRAHLERMAAGNIGRSDRTPAQRRALDATHAGNVGRRHTEETRAKMRATHARRLAAQRERVECQIKDSEQTLLKAGMDSLK